MNELRRMQKEVKRIIKEDYNLTVNNRGFDKYLWMYSKFIPFKDVTMNKSLEIILKEPITFVYFIHGCRAKALSKEYEKNNLELDKLLNNLALNKEY